VLGNRTLLDIAELRPTKLADLANIKGITDLLLRRMGRDIMAAIRKGRKEEHGPIPKLGNSRRRMDRHAEHRLAALKAWRAERAADTKLDPGVLAPNSVLEAIAWRDPSTQKDLDDLPELKGWFRREFGAEVVLTSRASNDAAPEKPENKPRSGRRGRGRGRRSKAGHQNGTDSSSPGDAAKEPA
jgi:ribonuclease D